MNNPTALQSVQAIFTNLYEIKDGDTTCTLEDGAIVVEVSPGADFVLIANMCNALVNVKTRLNTKAFINQGKATLQAWIQDPEMILNMGCMFQCQMENNGEITIYRQHRKMPLRPIKARTENEVWVFFMDYITSLMDMAKEDGLEFFHN